MIQILTSNEEKIKVINMKVNMQYKIKATPYGGGNQFLKTLLNHLIEKKYYTENVCNADIVIFNSHQFINDVAMIKFKYPEKIFIHRIDGPMRLYNNLIDFRDEIVNISNRLIADGTIFQSNWSRNENYKLGLVKSKFEKVIKNIPDISIFNTKNKYFFKNKKPGLIASSWSKNINKGFDVYKWLDNNLDFNKYDMSFIGNTPIRFKNIKLIKPVNSKKLAEILKEHDIYITASRNDPCSNSLLEAIYCGLIPICYNSGGHPEIIEGIGRLFNKKEEIPLIINEIIKKKKKTVYKTGEFGKDYINFFKKIYFSVRKSQYSPKRLTLFGYLTIILKIAAWKLKMKLFYKK